MSFHVMIIGGGIGGLCLAQGLKRAGVSVAVYERDRDRADRLQGYRIHISPAGSRALHECLPPELFDAFLATTGKSGDGFTLLTEQLRPLLRVTAADFAETGAAPVPADSHHSVSRITLRQVLLAGLDDVVRFDKKFVSYEQAPHGEITARFEDGSEAVADVLVAADGANSRVRRQYLPHAARLDTGIVGIAGKLPLDTETRPLVPAPLRSGAAFVGGAPGGKAMFFAVQEFDRARVTMPAITSLTRGIGSDGPEGPGFLFDNTSDYLMWGLTAPRGSYPNDGARLGSLDHAALRKTALVMIADWHPDLRRLLAESDPSATTLLPVHSSVPVAPWPSTDITLVGDAIHSMTPFRGIGANIALRDARLLSRNLVAAHRGELPLREAIGGYESEMIEYGFQAVRDSLKAARQATSDSALARMAGRAFLRLVNATPQLRRRLFAGD